MGEIIEEMVAYDQHILLKSEGFNVYVERE